MKKLLLIVRFFFIIFFGVIYHTSAHSFSTYGKNIGQGELKLPKYAFDLLEFYFSAGRYGELYNNPSDSYKKLSKTIWSPMFIIFSKNGKGMFWYYMPAGGTPDTTPNYVGKARNKCTKQGYGECFVFAIKDKIVWQNGINPEKGTRIKKKEARNGMVSIKLKELGFYDGGITKTKKIEKKKVEKKKEEKVAKSKNKGLGLLKKIVEWYVVVKHASKDYYKQKKYIGGSNTVIYDLDKGIYILNPKNAKDEAILIAKKKCWKDYPNSKSGCLIDRIRSEERNKPQGIQISTTLITDYWEKELTKYNSKNKTQIAKKKPTQTQEVADKTNKEKINLIFCNNAGYHDVFLKDIKTNMKDKGKCPTGFYEISFNAFKKPNQKLCYNKNNTDITKVTSTFLDSCNTIGGAQIKYDGKNFYYMDTEETQIVEKTTQTDDSSNVVLQLKDLKKLYETGSLTNVEGFKKLYESGYLMDIHDLNELYESGYVTDAEDLKKLYESGYLTYVEDFKKLYESGVLMDLEDLNELYESGNLTEEEFNKAKKKEKKIETKETTQTDDSSNILQQIKELKQLLDDGVLTKEEFTKAKKKLLN